MRKCLSCGSFLTDETLFMGHVPIGNRFRAHSTEPADGVDLTMAQCPECRLVQLPTPPDYRLLAPRVKWISYREPEGHLDDLAKTLLETFKLQSVAGVGPFESPLLSRLEAGGCTAAQIDLGVADLATDGRQPYLESWHARLQDDQVLDRSFGNSRFDLISLRYLLEHCSDPKHVLQGLSRYLSENGRILIEVPDSSKFLRRRDYCFPWEEHTSYFVEESLRGLCAHAGFEVQSFHRYVGDLEDALIAVIAPAASPAPPPAAPDFFSAYRAGFDSAARGIRAAILAHSGGLADSVVLFGVGHQAIMFANALGLTDLIGRVVDDEPNKGGLYPPGFATPVISSEALLNTRGIALCLLAVSPRSEPAVRRRLAPLLENGAKIASIFAGVANSIYPNND